MFGSSFSQHTGIDAGKPIIQVDFDRMTLGKFHPVAQPLWGEIGVAARLLREGLQGHEPNDQRAELAAAWATTPTPSAATSRPSGSGSSCPATSAPSASASRPPWAPAWRCRSALSSRSAVKYGLDMTHILLNNGELGKIPKEQRAGGWQVWQTSLRNPGFAAYARECGGFGIKVTEAGELKTALQSGIGFETVIFSSLGPIMPPIMSPSWVT